jgi:hypothetical protein
MGVHTDLVRVWLVFGADLVWVLSCGFWGFYLPGRDRGLVLSHPPLLYSTKSGFFQPPGGNFFRPWACLFAITF